MYSPMRRNTRKQQYTSAFDKNCFLRVQEDRQQKKKEAKKSRTDKKELMFKKKKEKKKAKDEYGY